MSDLKKDNKRLAIIDALEIMDASSEDELDRLTQMVSIYFGVPIALISLANDSRQWFQSKVELDICEDGGETCFCSYTSDGDDIFIVPDATIDERFLDNHLVCGPPHIVFYAGYPLKILGDNLVGTLAIIDHKPRELNEDEKEKLIFFSSIISNYIESRFKQVTQSKVSGILMKINELNFDWSGSVDQKINEYLAAGSKLLGLELGFQSKVTGSSFKYERALFPHELNLQYKDIEMEMSDGLVCEVFRRKKTIFYKTKNEKLKSVIHPDIGLVSTFIGSPIFIHGELYGAISFASVDSNFINFLEEEVSFIEIIARKIGRVFEYKKMERERKWLLETIEESQDFCGIADDHGNISFINKSFRKLVGLSDISAGNIHISAFHPESTTEKIKNIAFPYANKHRIWKGEVELINAEGENVPALQTLIAHKDEYGNLEYLTTIFQDITTLKQIDENLRKAKEDALKLSDARSIFLANISHEIRTPMNGVIGNIERLGETSLSEEQRDIVDTVIDCGNNLVKIINDVLDFTKAHSHEMSLDIQPFNLYKTLEHTYKLFSPQAYDKGIELVLETKIDSNKLYISDGSKLGQVINNLVSNAIKFTSSGHVKLSCHLSESKNGPDENLCEIVVEDTGMGIPSDKIDLIFKPFEQADSSITRHFGGTGLGLSICSEIVELLKGTIQVESEIGKGTVMKIQFPILVSDREELIAKVEDTAPERSYEHLKILFAEDNQINQKLIMNYMKKLGVKYDLAENGLEAYEFYKKNDYDLVFMDIQMPIMDGIESCQKILSYAYSQKERKRQFVVAVSANVFKDVQNRCTEVGMKAFITKPFKTKNFKDIFNQYLDDLEHSAKVESKTVA